MITACRACKSGSLVEALSLGDLAISDFVEPGTPIECAPLTWVLCEACGLVQLSHTVPRERLYSKYWYRSGLQEAMVRELQGIVAQAMGMVDLRPGDIVVDIGANDGTLLRQYPDYLTRIAFEPASNLWAECQEGGINVFPGFWPPAFGIKEKAKVITAIACFYDAEEPAEFLAQIREWLADDGVAILQLAYLPATLRTNNVGDICHEHLTYWTLSALSRAAEKAGLILCGESFNGTNGGSVRLSLRKAGSLAGAGYYVRGRSDDVDLKALRWFERRIGDLKHATVTGLESLKAHGHTVLGYGASTKGNTMLQYYGIGPELLPAIADRNPEKWGKVTPTGIPVTSEDAMRSRHPDYLLALPFHFIESFRQREPWAQWIVPLPELRMIQPLASESEHAHREPQAVTA